MEEQSERPELRAGLAKYQEDGNPEEDDAMLIDNTYLNTSNVAINENTGQEISVTGMSASQLKAELEAKGLSTSGLKSDLSRRVQVPFLVQLKVCILRLSPHIQYLSLRNAYSIKVSNEDVKSFLSICPYHLQLSDRIFSHLKHVSLKITVNNKSGIHFQYFVSGYVL